MLFVDVGILVEIVQFILFSRPLNLLFETGDLICYFFAVHHVQLCIHHASIISYSCLDDNLLVSFHYKIYLFQSSVSNAIAALAFLFFFFDKIILLFLFNFSVSATKQRLSSLFGFRIICGVLNFSFSVNLFSLSLHH